MYSAKIDVERLNRLYEIRGNGKARLIMAEAVKDPAFHETVRKLSQINLHGENQVTLARYLKTTRHGWNVRKLSSHVEIPETTLYQWWHTKRKLIECIVAGLQNEV